MSDLVNKALLNRMAILYFVVFSVNSLATVFVASFMHVTWSALTATERAVVIAVVLQNWTGVILAFLYRSGQKVEEGKPLFSGETAFIPKPTENQPTKPNP